MLSCQDFTSRNVKGVIKHMKEELMTFKNCVRFEDSKGIR